MIITLIVPNVTPGRPYPTNALYLRALEARLCQEFGGFTAAQGQGGWRGISGRVTCEPVTIYTIATYRPGVSDICTNFRDLAREIARDLEQECVYLSFSTDNAEFIVP